MQGILYRNFYARCRLNRGTAFHGTGFAVLPFTVLVCNSCLGGVCFPLYARDSISWFAGARMDQC